MGNKLDVLNLISPGMKAVLAKENELIAASGADANDTSVGFDVMRKNYVAGRAYWVEGGPEMADTHDDVVGGPSGDIPVRYYYPNARTEQVQPAIIYVHGGGFVLGNLETHDRICRVLAAHAGVPVVAVDYRLSPEAKFPSAVHETAAVATYLHEHGAQHGIDGSRLAFAGDSGGAHLNLAATLYLREEQGDASFVKCLLLYYGWYGLTDSSSMRLLGGPWDGLTEEDWKFYMELYTVDPAQAQQSPYCNLFLNDLTHDMPACYIAAAEYDPLRDDSATLAAICNQYGIPYKHEVLPGTIHAFLHYTKMLDEANDALEHGATFYRQQLGL